MFDKLRAKIALAVLPKADGKLKINPFQVMSTQPANVPVYTEMTVRKATREGYKINVAVFRCVRVIVQAASAIPWIVEDKEGEPIKNHPLANVLAHPNPQFSGQDMMELLIAHSLLVGNALWMPIIVGKRVTEIWPVMPDLVKPIPSDAPGEWLKGWQVYGQTGALNDLPPEHFIHFMQLDPGNLFWGISPLMAAARTIDTDNEAQDTQKVSMQNRGLHDGVFTHESNMTLEQFEEARRQIRETFLAKSKRREPWVLGAGAKWNSMGMTSVEMDFIASRLQNKRDIAAAFGISPIFLGDLEQSSYNNMMEARKALYEDVVIPLLDDVKSTLNMRLAPLYGDVTLSYDTSKVAALRPDFSAKVEQAKTLFGMGVPFDQINERLEMGFDEFPNWGLGYLPMTIAPTGAATEEPEVEEEEEDDSEDEKALNLDTEDKKALFWKRVDRRRMGWWGVVARKVEALYKGEAEAVARALRTAKAKSSRKASVTQLMSVAREAINSVRPEWEKVITAVLVTLIGDFGEDIARDLGAGEPKSDGTSESKWAFDPTTPAIRSWVVKHGTASIKTILNTNLVDVNRVILAGLDENLGVPKIAMNVRRFYADSSKYKAMRVARTEVSQAAGFGQREAARQSGVAETHTWVTSRDDRVRDDHAALDGETAKFDKAYSDGSMYPGEKDINCRCVETFGTKGPRPVEPKPTPKPAVPSGPRVQTHGKISKEAVDNVNGVVAGLPEVSRNGVKSIHLFAKRGEMATFDSGKFVTGGTYGKRGTIRIYDAARYSERNAKFMIGHESGHGSWYKLSKAVRNKVEAVTRKEGAITSYSRSHLAENFEAGLMENFAEMHKMFVMGGAELQSFRTGFAESYKLFSKIWVDNLGGVLP